MNISSENSNVSRMVTDFNRILEKKAQKKVNTLLSFTMKAISRDQEKNFLISRLQKELRKNIESLSLLEIENEVKEELINIKDKELESLRFENTNLKTLLQQNKEKVSKTIEDKSLIILNNTCNNNNDNNFSANSNNAFPIKNTLVLKSNSLVSSPGSLIKSIKPKGAQKRSLQKVKETNVTSVSIKNSQ
ncbi:PREDICTED: FNIP repeat-containing protein DDB_G0290617-like [Ceratosolen solmsi marchali]|uniref:FNIP repeat-containing protein DDB_G0290617-like n=1 Tax=Ceratosolen solmsi marchali TaxID=326594 RepID=A0AAJ6YWE6_9HYME|nr:PREDICTED: FNIP repeat-containing protein DDB_G0290617-like [Ceratosolen solmsi marchali]